MKMTRGKIEEEALALPRGERAALAHRLILSLDESDDDDPTDAELAWRKKIQQRLGEYPRGEVRTVSSASVFAKARMLLK